MVKHLSHIPVLLGSMSSTENRGTREEEKEKIEASLMQVPALRKQWSGC